MSELWHSAVAEYSADEMSMDEYFEHWGIKGMKWGVRRYQNADGSLTEAGRRRYLEGTDDIHKNRDIRKITTAAKEDAHFVRRKVSNLVNPIGGAAVGAVGGLALKMLVPALPTNTAMTLGGVAGAGIAAVGKAAARGLKVASREIIRYIKDRRNLSKEALSGDEVDKFVGTEKEHRKQETKCLAKAVDGGSFGKKFLDFMNGKLKKETKQHLNDFDSVLDKYRSTYDMASNKEKRHINRDTVYNMQRYAKEMLIDMGWEPTNQNIYYLTQIVWGNDYAN